MSNIELVAAVTHGREEESARACVGAGTRFWACRLRFKVDLLENNFLEPLSALWPPFTGMRVKSSTSIFWFDGIR